MAGIEVPDSGAVHPEAADGDAFNGPIGLGVAKTLLEIVSEQKDVSSICDLGCGHGYLAGQLGSRGYAVVGVDASDTYLQFAREHHGANPRVTFVKALINGVSRLRGAKLSVLRPLSRLLEEHVRSSDELSGTTM
ncbi:MAG: class I SAM-dependent methyltransferase [Cyanobacteria bacterium]|nr:class I SAM-dependent methyltransferase [Cyanobacteriota bacterium]